MPEFSLFLVELDGKALLALINYCVTKLTNCWRKTWTLHMLPVQN